MTGHHTSLIRLLGAILLGAGTFSARVAGGQAPTPRGDRRRAVYENVRSVIDWSVPELLKAIPELKGLEPANSPSQANEELPVILRKVGENVESFFRDFPDTASVEQVRLERLGDTDEASDQKFRYLALARQTNSGVGLDEYRTDKRGNPAGLHGMAGPYVLTQGFVSMPIHFHPRYQGDSVFRYLGHQTVEGRETKVVAFAQVPAKARVVGRVTYEGGDIIVLVQGVAWIDSTSYQIVRLRTDLLAPRPEMGLKTQTTVVQFGEVHFESRAQTLWLPLKVRVSLQRGDQTFRNEHRYSHFQLFTVETEEKKADRQAHQPC